MKDDKIQDIRWQTRNTKLASALLCKGFLLAAQPFLTSVISGSQTTTIYFQPAKREGDEELSCEAVEEAWQIAEHAEPEGMPELHWMRGSLYSRDYLLVKYIHATGNVPTSGQLPARPFKTDDLSLAACLHSAGNEVLLFRDQRFYFAECAKGDALYYDSKANPEHPMQWRRVVLLQQYSLIGAIRKHQAGIVKTIAGPGKRTAILPMNMPEDLMRQCLRELHRNH